MSRSRSSSSKLLLRLQYIQYESTSEGSYSANSAMVTISEDKKYDEDWGHLAEIYEANLNRRCDKVAILREWATKQPHLPNVSDTTLALVITIANESIEMAKDFLDSYFTIRTLHPHVFTKIDKKILWQQLDLVEVALRPIWKVERDGGSVIFARLIDTDASKVDFLVAMQAVMAVSDLQVALGAFGTGVAVILDMTGFHLGYFPLININIVAITLKYIQLFEHKISHAIVINCSPLITQVMALIRPFLGKHLADQIHLFTPKEMDKLHDLIPPKCIPSDYGGQLPSMKELNDSFRTMIHAYEPWLDLLNSDQYRTKENLRQGKRRHETYMEGSFRQLTID